MELTASQRDYLCREHGICSIPDCDQPIMGWVEKYGPKLCQDHLEEEYIHGKEIYQSQRYISDYFEVTGRAPVVFRHV